MTEQVLSKQLSVTATQVDMFRRLRLSSLFALLQETAIEHTILLGCPREKTLDRGLLWIVTHYCLRIARLPLYDEQLTLLTWPGKTMHLLFPRYWQILDAQGQPVLEASSLWVLMDEKERRIAFPEHFDITIPGTETGKEIPLPKRYKMGEMSRDDSLVLPPSLVDMTGPLNNARYIDIVQDVLPFEFYEKQLREISVEYVNEVRLGQTLDIRYGLDEEKNTVQVLGETDKTVFRMHIFYT